MTPFNLSTSNLTMKNAMFKYGESFAFPKRRSELYTIKWINQKKLLPSKLQLICETTFRCAKYFFVQFEVNERENYL